MFGKCDAECMIGKQFVDRHCLLPGGRNVQAQPAHAKAAERLSGIEAADGQPEATGNAGIGRKRRIDRLAGEISTGDFDRRDLDILRGAEAASFASHRLG